MMLYFVCEKSKNCSNPRSSGGVGSSMSRVRGVMLRGCSGASPRAVANDVVAPADKLDSSFSRSRSSSMSSLENISQEGVQCLAFADSYTKKSGELLQSIHLISLDC